ncbi:MAG: hypothetical protein ACLUIQ_08315 [Dialister invisus]
MMGNKIFKALTAVAAAAAAVWLLPKRKKEMAVRPVPAGESMSCIREQTGVNEDALCLYYYRPGRWTEKDAVFIAFHGFGRDGAEYCKALRSWRRKKYADRLSGVDGKEVSRRGMVSGRRHHGCRRTYP